jgi:hypothetical protein
MSNSTTHPSKPAVGDFVEFRNGIRGMIVDAWYSRATGCMVGWLQTDPESDAISAVTLRDGRYTIV